MRKQLISVPASFSSRFPDGTSYQAIRAAYIQSMHPEEAAAKVRGENASSTMTTAQADTMPHTKPLHLPNRTVLTGVSGPHCEGLREISEAWGMKWRFNKRTICAECNETSKGYKELRKHDRQELKEHILTRCTMEKGKPVKFSNIRDMDDPIVTLAKENAVDPILLFLKTGLPEWDGTERLQWQLMQHFNTPDGYLERWASAYPYIATIQRAFEPGCILQEFPIYVGEQNVGKSTYLQQIVPVGQNHMTWVNPQFRFERNPRATFYKVKKSAIVEWSEMDGILDANNEALKAWLTSSYDVIDEKYLDTDVYPRRFIIVGTCNPANAKLPNDPDGNRRFVMVNCPDRVEGALQEVDRIKMQVWAEALYKYRNDGLRANLPKDLQLAQKARNADHRNADDLETIIEEMIAEETFKEGQTANEIAQLLFMTRADSNVAEKSDQMRIAKAMQNIGWVSKRTRLHKVQATRYYKPK